MGNSPTPLSGLLGYSTAFLTPLRLRLRPMCPTSPTPPPLPPTPRPYRQGTPRLASGEGSLANCHRGIDPWGLPLERFDAVGLLKTHRSPLLPAGKRPAKPKPVPIDSVATLPTDNGSRGR